MKLLGHIIICPNEDPRKQVTFENNYNLRMLTPANRRVGKPDING